MGQEHHGLVSLRLPFAVDIVDHDGEGNRENDAEDDEDNVVQQGIPQNHAKLVGLQEKGEVLQTSPVAVEQAVHKAFPCRNLVVLKRKNQTKHGQVAE